MMFQRLLTVLVLLCAVFFVGCEKELAEISSESTPTPLLASGVGSHAPDSHCGSTQSANLLHESTSEGSVQILNNSSDLYMVLDMNHGFFIDAVYAFYGESSNAPVDSEGNLSLEEFSFIASVGEGASSFTIQVPLSEISSCNDLMVAASVSQRNVFGQVTTSHMVWMDGTDFMNGFYLSSCVQSCN